MGSRLAARSLALLILGSSWALPASGQEVGTGLWWIAHGDGAPLQVRLYPDGRAWSDFPSNNPGRWWRDEQRIMVLWADDWKEVLLPRDSGGWVKQGFEPGRSWEQTPSNQSRAVQATSHPNGWLGPSP